ncbi:MAG TPA: HAD-IB family phosphatase [Ignavibacteria bacterium]
MVQNKLKIFCDFDGTITIYDTWIDMGEYFIKDKSAWYNVIHQFEEQKIGARECFIRECELIENFDLNDFYRIIDNQKLDPGFMKFNEYCKTKGIPIIILSEGMDYYIARILNNYGIELPYFSNRFVLHNDKKSFHLEFPYSDSDCTKCGTSKRNLLMNMTGEDEISVFIGDGFSDACVSNYADIVFAKKSLASYCWKNNITYFDWISFKDIQNKLEKLLSHKNLKHRQTAKIKRRDVYLRG